MNPTPRISSPPAPRGISLLEVLIATVMLATLSFALSSSLISSMQLTRQDEEYQAAARAARDKMEEIVSQSILRISRDGVGNPVLDPHTGQYQREIDAFAFEDLPVELQEEAVGTPFAAVRTRGTLSSGPGLDTFGRLHPFRVYLRDYNPENPLAATGVLQGLRDEFAGEVIIVDSETYQDLQAGTSVPLDPSKLTHIRGIGMYGGDLLPRDGVPDGFTSFSLPLDLNGDNKVDSNRAQLRNGKQHIRFAVGVIVRWWGAGREERYETWTVLSKY